MAVKKEIEITAKYVAGHGVSQVTEIQLRGGQVRQMGFEDKAGVKTMTVVGSRELESLMKGFANLDAPIYHEDPDTTKRQEAEAKAAQERQEKEYEQQRAQRSQELGAARVEAREGDED